MIAAEHHLRVVHDVNREDERTERRVNQNHGFTREEHANDAEHHEDDDGDKENAPHSREVHLGLKCEHCESDSHYKGDQGRKEDLKNKTGVCYN